MTPEEAYAFILLSLAIWREARGELITTKIGVAWTVRNRVQNPGWWGHDWLGCLLLPWQYSCFNHNDPNATKLPMSKDPSWQDSLNVARNVMHEPPLVSDPTGGATSYYDTSLDSDPPKWATDGSNVHTITLGGLNFYKLAA